MLPCPCLCSRPGSTCLKQRVDLGTWIKPLPPLHCEGVTKIWGQENQEVNSSKNCLWGQGLRHDPRVQKDTKSWKDSKGRTGPPSWAWETKTEAQTLGTDQLKRGDRQVREEASFKQLGMDMTGLRFCGSLFTGVHILLPMLTCSVALEVTYPL